MENIIVLLRHAATEGGGGRAIGRTPLALSHEGEMQAAALTQTLPRLLEDVCGSFLFQAVYTSPALRAQNTLAPLLRQTGQQPHVLPELDEIDLGQWDGLHFDDIRRCYPDAYAERGADMAGFRPPQGESFEDVSLRVRKAMALIGKGPFPALAVTHAGCIRTLLCRCSGVPLEELFVFSPCYAQPYVFRVEGDSLHWLRERTETAAL